MKGGMQKERWSHVSWPWEIELFTLLLVILAVYGPFILGWFYLPEGIDFDQLAYRPHDELEVRQSFLGASFVLLLYVTHIFWASSTTEFITVSASHLLAPTLFGMAAYLRIAQHNFREGLTQSFFNGLVWEVLVIACAVQAVTWLLARNRMNLYLKRFRGERWEMVEHSRSDVSYVRLVLARIQPLFYPPRRFRASREGLLVEGFSYLMPIPFAEVEQVFPVRQSQLSSPGTYLARSAHDLIGLKLFEEMDPVFISPEHPTEFFTYCEDRVEILRYQPRGPVEDAAAGTWLSSRRMLNELKKRLR